MTGNDIVRRALRLIGKLGEGETPTGQAAQDARGYLNEMIDQWQADKIMVFASKESTHALTAGVGSYTIGTGGTWDQTRPVRITRANVIPDSGASPVLEIPIRVYTPQEWASIRQKAITSTYPFGLYYDQRMNASARGTVTVYPIPTTTTVQVVLWTEDVLNQFTDLVTDFQFPPGYAIALRQNLAVLLAPEYGLEATQTLARQAAESLAVITRTNADDEQMVVDWAVMGARTGGYNILTDES